MERKERKEKDEGKQAFGEGDEGDCLVQDGSFVRSFPPFQIASVFPARRGSLDG